MCFPYIWFVVQTTSCISKAHVQNRKSNFIVLRFYSFLYYCCLKKYLCTSVLCISEYKVFYRDVCCSISLSLQTTAALRRVFLHSTYTTVTYLTSSFHKPFTLQKICMAVGLFTYQLRRIIHAFKTCLVMLLTFIKYSIHIIKATKS